MTSFQEIIPSYCIVPWEDKPDVLSNFLIFCLKGKQKENMDVRVFRNIPVLPPEPTDNPQPPIPPLEWRCHPLQAAPTLGVTSESSSWAWQLETCSLPFPVGGLGEPLRILELYFEPTLDHGRMSSQAQSKHTMWWDSDCASHHPFSFLWGIVLVRHFMTNPYFYVSCKSNLYWILYHVVHTLNVLGKQHGFTQLFEIQSY